MHSSCHYTFLYTRLYVKPILNSMGDVLSPWAFASNEPSIRGILLRQGIQPGFDVDSVEQSPAPLSPNVRPVHR
jgi:hypothetical protein